MGIYNNNTTSLGMYDGEEIVANENYVGNVGAFQIMIEGAQNDQAIFEALISGDFAEAAALHEGANIEVLSEASVSSFVEKIKEFIKKVWAKIKGLFQSFLAKFNGVVMRDNKKFVDKYKREVLGKDLSKMKFKWSKPKKDLTRTLPMSITESDLASLVGDCMTESLDKIKKDLNDNYSDIVDQSLSQVTDGSTDSKSFTKDFHETYFDDVDTEEGISSSDLSSIMSFLYDTKLIGAIQKEIKAVDKIFGTQLKTIDKAKNETAKSVPGGKGAEDTMQRLNLAYKAVSLTQSVTSRVSSAYLTACKFHTAQCRRVFAQAASYRVKSVKEDAILIDAIGEAVEYEVMSDFNDYSLN